MSFRSNQYDWYNNISYNVRGKETSQSLLKKYSLSQNNNASKPNNIFLQHSDYPFSRKEQQDNVQDTPHLQRPSIK